MEVLRHSRRLKPKQEWQDSKQLAASFMAEFEDIFEASTIEQRKVLLQRCIREIVVGRGNEEACVIVRRLPVVTPILERILEKSENEQQCVSFQSARNRVRI